MKKIHLLIFLVFPFLMAKSQTKDSIIQYAVIVKFNSECCGVPNGTPLRKAVLKFKKKQHLKSIESFKIGPLGREGEYMAAFTLKEMNNKQKTDFIKMIKATIPGMKDKGYAEFEDNYSTPISSLPSNISIEKVNFK
jgi:hypothetical protein